MNTRTLATGTILIFSLLLAMLPVVAQAAEQAAAPPPISQPLATEGALAVSLTSALDLDTMPDEVEAETILGDLGVAPRNGWIADYPVTPDIIGELQQSVAAAADAGRLPLDRDEALQRFGDVLADFGLTVRPYAGESALDKPVSCGNYPNPALINSTYSGDGPPIVTYYCPPPDYYGLYAWVPYPFWWSNFWFSGFFILKDFDRHVHFRHRHARFTNHFRAANHHRAFRIDPVDRFRGRTYPGIGAKHSRDFISTGVPNSSRTIFNRSRGGTGPAERGGRGPSVKGGSSRGGGMHGGGSRGGGGGGRRR